MTPPRPSGHMTLALREAQLAAGRGEVPVGAVIVAPGGKVLASDGNRTRAQNDPTAHAEMLVIRQACKMTGMDFRNMKGCVRKALDYVGARQASDGGFGYTGTQPVGNANNASLTGVGMLSYQIWGKGSAAPVRKGAKYAAARMRFDWETEDCDLYAHYYLSQAMFQRGGKEWEDYQPMILESLMNHQAEDGSWPVPGGGSKPKAAGALFANNTADGRHYRTVLAALMLEVYYRYLPATR